MKKSLAIILTLCLVLTMGIGTNAATSTKAASKSLVVYCPHPVEFINPIVSEFENKTGIKVEVITAGTGELLKRVEAEKANPLGDVLWGGSLSTVTPKKDLFQVYKSPNEATVFPTCRNTEGMLTRFTNIPSVIMVNTKLIGNINITGYQDLLNPALKGKIAFADPAKSSSSFEHLINMLYAMGKGNPDKGWDYVGKLVKNLNGKLLGGSSAVYQGVANGEYTVGLTFEEGAAKYVKSKAPVKIIYMKEGVISKPDTVQIIKGAKNLDNAKKFIDFVTSKTTQQMIASKLNRRSVRKDVYNAFGLKPFSDMKLIKDNPAVVDANKQNWLDKFKDIFTSN